MFGKKKSLPERALTTVGNALDGHVIDIAKHMGSTLAAAAVVTVGASALVNALRDDRG